MNELVKVRKYMEQFNMAEKGESVIVGVSGGADSVCLYKILLELKNYFDIDISGSADRTFVPLLKIIGGVIRGKERY